MSPRDREHADYDARFPRVSGDEPLVGIVVATPCAFSPRERG